jgi:hypothetical protein
MSAIMLFSELQAGKANEFGEQDENNSNTNFEHMS